MIPLINSKLISSLILHPWRMFVHYTALDNWTKVDFKIVWHEQSLLLYI